MGFYEARPMVDGRKVLCDGQVTAWTGPVQEVFAPIYEPGSSDKKILIGYQARFDEADSLKALDAARKSWNMGRGAWAQATPAHRIAKICKTKADATKEFDRTMDFVRDVIKTYKAMLDKDNKFIQDSGVIAQVQRSRWRACVLAASLA